ncbi:hypothetical protein [Paenibacillus sp. BT-177]|uniref:hypothetical protein n=1 Tax=Paenibacillus sp. BT-177 TaxID=2986930 RepID=UPI0021F7F710|nr:hypothetical protein [Paenibacillus sp. BT-177]
MQTCIRFDVYDGRKYARSIKSPAMGRTQRTEFIQEKYIADLYQYITIDKMPPLTISISGKLHLV